VRVADLAQIPPVMERLRAAPPAELGTVRVARVDDLARGGGGLPPTEGVRWFLADRSRVIVRPSGTEPKLKVYLEAIEPVPDAHDLAASRRTAADRLTALRTAMESLTQV
jgi:phosphomannomutase